MNQQIKGINNPIHYTQISNNLASNNTVDPNKSLSSLAVADLISILQPLDNKEINRCLPSQWQA